jgi:hypothetical protein
MFDKTFWVFLASYHGAKLLNAHPEVSALGAAYPSKGVGEI